MDFRQWVEDRYRHPVVLVLESSTVEKACRRNGMSLIQMLRPFSVYPKELYARLGDRADASVVRNFGVRFRRVHCVREVSPTQLVSHLRSVMRSHSAIELAYGEQIDRSITSLLKENGGFVECPLLSSQAASQLLERSNPAWYSQFIRDYVHLVRCSHFDTIDYPIGCIYTASTGAQGGIDGVMNEFKEQQELPAETRRNMPCMDDGLHSYYLLVHDVTEGPSINEALRMLAAVQARYGHVHCALLKINSVVNPQDMKNMDPSFWVEANAPSMDIPSYAAVRAVHEQQQQCGIASMDTTHSVLEAGSCSSIGSGSNSSKTPTCLQMPGMNTVFGTWPNGMVKVTGCYMSPENVEDLRSVMFYYLSQSLFNFVERKLRAVTVTVNDKRTTTLSKVAAWFRNKDEVKSRSECWVNGRDGGPTKYLAGSLEMLMRRAADLSLVLADYDSAVSFYRMCRNEALSTLSSREFNRPLIAACQEGIGICDLIQGRLSLPSLMPWMTGVTSSKNSGDCRLEVARNDYITSQVQTYALRLSFLLYEYCRTRTPPALNRATAALLYIQRFDMTARNKFYSAVLHELLATTDLFLNPPKPLGISPPVQLPDKFPVHCHIRRYVRNIILAGSSYFDENLFESSLRCHLRALRVCGEVGRRGHWQIIFEHLHTIIGQIYHNLGKHTRGIAMQAIAVSMGTPMYSNLVTGMRNFDSFWGRQQQVLSDLGYSICPHMVLPCILPDSVCVSVNEFHCDELTKQEMRVDSNDFNNAEWKKMENRLRAHYMENSPTSPRHCFSPRGELMKMQRPGEGGGMQCYFMHLTEPLGIEVTLRNPIGGTLKVEKFCLLYVAKRKPDQLWKSISSQSVKLPPGASKSVTVIFSPCEEGAYTIIGFCWTLMGVEGYYYFATQAYAKSEKKGDSNSTPILEYALHHPTPNIESPENLEVVVKPPRGWITAQFEPELPSIIRDGEYYRTSLILRNNSSQQGVHKIMLQRGNKNSHLVWFETFGLEQNLDPEKTLVLEQELGPEDSITLPLVVQAQYAYDCSPRCRKSIPFLVGYSAVESSRNEVEGEASPSSTCLCLHRFLRRMMVKPTIRLSSILLPPANSTMATAVLLTASNVSEMREPPVRISRVLAAHRPRWSVAPTCLGTLLKDNAVECIVPSGGALSISLNVLGKAPSEMMGCADSASGTQSDLVEETCIPLKAALPAPTKLGLVEANIGTSVVDSAVNLYFMRCRFRGHEVIDEGQTRDGLSFYLDKKSSVKTSVGTEGRKSDGWLQQHQEQGHMTLATVGTDDVEPFTPICVAVAWVAEENGHTYSGQLFHFVDPVSFLCSGSSMLVEAYESMQDHLCRSMFENHTLHPRSGALFYYVDVSHTVQSAATLPDVVLIPLRLHCRSFAAQPLIVTVKAEEPFGVHDPHSPSLQQKLSSPVPLTFVGKTKCAFLLLPHETHTVDFTACAHSFGFVQCNAFRVSAVALNLPSLDGVVWKTGMSRGDLLASLNGAGTLPRPSRTSVPRTTSILEATAHSSEFGHGRNTNNRVSSSPVEDLEVLVCSDTSIMVEGHHAVVMTRALPGSFMSNETISGDDPR